MYEWKSGSRINLDPEEAAGVLNAIADRDGRLQPEAVVDEARHKDNPLHDYFVWDNREAAEQYRITQARYLIRSIVVRVERENEDDIITRAIVSVVQNGERGYSRIENVLTDDEAMASLLQQAIKDLEWYQKKYAVLSDVSAAIETMLQKLRQLA